MVAASLSRPPALTATQILLPPLCQHLLEGPDLGLLLIQQAGELLHQVILYLSPGPDRLLSQPAERGVLWVHREFGLERRYSGQGLS